MSEIKWYQNPKIMNWVYTGVGLLLGATGTNLDRVGTSWIPTNPSVLERLDKLEKNVEYNNNLEEWKSEFEKEETHSQEDIMKALKDFEVVKPNENN